MIDKFVNKWNEKKNELLTKFTKHPDNYKELVTWVVEFLTDDDYSSIDPQRIHEIDDGDYQGTLLYVIGAKGYQPSEYWTVKVHYGSCSGCDTLQAISGYSSEPPTQEQVSDYMTLCLHIIQRLKET